MKFFKKRWGALIFFCFFVFWGIYKLYIVSCNSVKTETARCQLVEDIIKTQGFAVWDESILDLQADNNVLYKLNDADKVQKGGIIAEIYEKIEDADTNIKIQSIDEELNMLKNLDSAQISNIRTPDILDEEINKTIFEMKNTITAKENAKAFAYRNKIISLINERKLSIGEGESFSERINFLSDMKQKLKNSIIGNVNKIYAEKSGHFFSFTDGYEGHFNYKDVKNSKVNCLSVNNIEYKEKNRGYAGKIVNSVDWYILCNVNNETRKKLKKGAECKVKIPSVDNDFVDCTIYDIKENENGENLVTICCSFINKDVLYFRKGEIELKINEYYGYKIKKNWLSYENTSSSDDAKNLGDVGVNIKYGNIVLFKKIKIIYSDDDFVIAAENVNDNETKCLKGGDQIITEGTNLYDGKLINY